MKKMISSLRTDSSPLGNRPLEKDSYWKRPIFWGELLVPMFFFSESSSLEPWNILWQLVSHHGLRSDSSAFRIVLVPGFDIEAGRIHPVKVKNLADLAKCPGKLSTHSGRWISYFFRCKARYWLSRKILQKHLEFLTRGISWAKSFGLPQCCSQTTSFTAFLPEKKHTKNTFFTQLIFHSSYKAAISRQVTGVATEKWTIFDMNSKIPAARFLEDPRLRPTKATEVFQALWWGKLGETSKNHHQIVLVIISVFREIHPNLSVCVFFIIFYNHLLVYLWKGVPWCSMVWGSFGGCQKRCDLGQLGQASRGRAVTSHGLVLGQPGNGWMDG